MKVILKLATVVLCSAFALNAANAQVPAALPHKDTVPAGERQSIDGVWRISTLNKRIRFEGGRAYAVDPWVHALLWRIEPGMVVVNNIVETEKDVFKGYDLPLKGNTELRWQADNTINVKVAGAFGPVRYSLLPDGVEDKPAPVAAIAHEGPAQIPASNRPQAPTDLPNFQSANAFTGCDEDDNAIPEETEQPRERIASEEKIDRLTKRRFASFSLDEVENESDNKAIAGLCWFRIDGVWRELSDITLDRRKDQPDFWGTDVPELIVLANGNYTTPNHLFIGSVGNDDEELYVAEGFSDAGFARFTSTGGPTLRETLQRGGPVKTYTTNERFEFGRTLSIDVSRSGRVRLKLGNTTYLRPKPGVSKSSMSSQIAANDAFLLSYNLENLSASRKGYDIIKQDPFYLLQNPKFDVFAAAGPKEYFISEKRTVPLGLTLIQEASQGMIFNKSIVSSGKELQKTLSVSFGASVQGNGYAMGVPVQSSAAFDAAVSGMSSMEQNNSVGQAIGFSRAKQYALVVDHPYVTLSDDFLDAIEDARRYGNYRDIIDNFGTHYPYAVTYGAAAKVTQSVTEESWRKIAEVNTSAKAEFAADTLGNGGSAYLGVSAGKRTGSSGSIGEEGATFVAVGGNGSWNENGYSAGSTPYPILTDLRPLYELLNPLNFPEEPEVYFGVRDELRRYTEEYIAAYSNRLSGESRLPFVQPLKPEPIETWHVYVPTIWCTGKKTGFVKTVTSKLNMEAYKGSDRRGFVTTKDKKLDVECRKKKKNRNYKYRAGQDGLLIISGTRRQIQNYTIALDLDWRYLPWGKNKPKTSKKAYKTPDAMKRGLAVGRSADTNWTVSTKGNPRFTLKLRMKRVK